MSRHPSIWPTALSHLKSDRPDHPVLYFAPQALQDTACRFQSGFDGLVTYAVKANDARVVLENLIAAGITTFDVASPAEMRKLRAISATVDMHYNNPVRSRAEIAEAAKLGVVSYSVDGMSELAKLVEIVPPEGVEVTVRLRLPVKGAAYDFGEKFGEDPDGAVKLLQAVVEAGFTPAMTFHPGTQCADPAAWSVYIDTCADVARRAGVSLTRLNVGGGFAANRGVAPDLEAIFAAIHSAVRDAFGDTRPGLVCEPGRAMVAEAYALATQVKSLRDCGSIFLNDGIYGGFAEAPLIGVVDRITTMKPDGTAHQAPLVPRVVYGPTCDSVDRLPDPLMLPETLEEGDYLIFEGMGAYSTATVTRFNGYGAIRVITVQSNHD
ncbi:type III PLP-dependent enzyme [Aliiroseovarius subalbicans]|uniref:type III PLP-dependent enzyme n=1 Tax=Aliiroseovarius subalbicans TaxID=2925840 RepID=UPI001F56B8FB|nr:type III PLP-dependent enzyme [Aliiroseovarius subalbicans]MCI2399042.1 type III PLP-dependent enzyme [Aliiroseovarius subalbicans]